MVATSRIAFGNACFNVATDGYETYWNEVTSGRWENTTLDLINEKLGPEKLFIDCGGWIGGTALPAAAKGAHVVVYEPNPVAADFLRQNIALNPGFEKLIEVHEVALNTEDGPVKLFNNHAARYRSTRSTLFVQEGDYLVVPSISVKTAVHRDHWERASLIKCDVESAEYFLIPHISQALGKVRPPMLIEFHPTYLTGSGFGNAVIDCAEALSKWPYRMRAEGTYVTIDQRTPLKSILNTPYSDPERGNIINPRIFFSAAP